VRNGPKCDAYGVYLKPFRIGKYTVRGGVPFDVLCNHEVRIEYRVSSEENDGPQDGLRYTHNIRPLLDEEFARLDCESRCEMLEIPIEVTYKNFAGYEFSSPSIVLLHCPGMHRGTFIAMNSKSQRLITPSATQPERLERNAG
jgi:hypothetical protein